MVENTSFTGNSGCEVLWTLTLKETTALHLTQDAGTIKGEGKLNSLHIELAAGNIIWKDGHHPLNIQLSAGNLKLLNTSFPKEGSSQISVATGNATITSPSDATVTTVMSVAMGKAENDFQKPDQGHALELNIALGNASHLSK